MKTFTDNRGSIHDFEDGTHVITCKAGSKRANHYHKTSGHRSILTRGSLFYFERPTGTNQKIRVKLIRAPAIFDTTFMVDHLMYFNEDSEFVCLRIGGSGTPEEYEKDVVRLDYDMAEEYDKYVRESIIGDITPKDIAIVFDRIKELNKIHKWE